MNRILSILFYFFISIATTFSQNPNYYDSNKIIHGDGYSYKCDISKYGGFVTLYNIDNKYTYTEWARKDGKPISEDILMGREQTFKGGFSLKDYSYSIINNKFTEAEKKALKGYGIILNIIISTSSPNQGIIEEVNFEFLKDSPIASIPITRFRAIELEIKKLKPRFALTIAGSQLNYCMSFWSYEFK